MKNLIFFYLPEKFFETIFANFKFHFFICFFFQIKKKKFTLFKNK